VINFDVLNGAIEDIEAAIAREKAMLASAPTELGFVWDQSDWCHENACGTAMCLAGFMAVRLGAELPPLIEGTFKRHMWYVNPNGQWSDDIWADERLSTIPIGDWVTNEVGLTGHQTDALFNPLNSLTDIKVMRDALVANPSNTLEGL
jgi:hypothetical protein